ncbi:hypothetical protein [Planctomycetes bacterium K23_9]|uniref:Uncharacterized protein n=1 Tax=Stieleria marina TaxID=1930275 RepID=A0A517NVE9_9BACT|nr:hypothetical protein K239x_30870 [Planctomycetes bacterium K23_9]
MTQRGFDDVSVDVSADATRNADPGPVQTKATHSYLARRAVHESGLFRWLEPIETDLIPVWSVVSGLMGIGVALFFLGGLAGAGKYWLDEQIRAMPLPMNLQIVYLQTIYLPIAAISAVALVVIMFWFPSIILRFVTALFILAPGTTAFFWVYEVIQGDAISSFFYGVPALLMSFFVGSATIGLAMQMMTPWELTHCQWQTRKRRLTGITSLMELTVVVALAYALFKRLEGGEISVQNAQLLSLGFLFSLPTLVACILFLRLEQSSRSRIQLALAFVALAWAGSFAFVCFEVIPYFGTSILPQKFSWLATLSLLGTLLTVLTTAISMAWLRFCGWSCQK